MIHGRRVAAILLIFFASAAVSAEVVVLKGGAVIELKVRPVRRGDNVLLTRKDGTLLSVSASEIDREATAAATTAAARAAAAPAPPDAALRQPATPADAARASREAPKARVRITDADVSHGEASASAAAAEGEAASDVQKEKEGGSGAGRVEVAEYTQEKSGEALIVRGTLRNPGATPAVNVRMTVTALDDKGLTITSGEAGVSNGVIEPSRGVAFSVSIGVGNRPVASLRFSPRWVSAALPEPPSAAEAAAARPQTESAASAPPPRAAAPPPAAPTPYGRGTLYAPPAPSAPSEAPKDGKTGYLPGASHPSNQPKPPS